jgi:photosystem II stability/assembly factor-like uncharacterized protein
MMPSVDDRLRVRLAALADAVPLDPARPARMATASRPVRAPIRTAALPGALGTMALLVVLVAGLAWVAGRPPAASPGSSVVDVSTDGDFQLTIRAERSTYAVDAPITVGASLVYRGSQPSITVFGGGSLVLFGVEQLDGAHHVVEPVSDAGCRQRTLERDQPVDVAFSKSGAVSDADPDASFKASYLADPLLRLPAGTWRINAEASFDEASCGGPAHHFRASVIVTVSGPTATPTPATNPAVSPTPTASPSSGVTSLQATAVAFWSAKDGLIGTTRGGGGSAGGSVLVTHDGGASWSEALGTPGGVDELWVVNPDAAWAVTGCGPEGDQTCRHIYRSTDGGATWNSSTTDVTWVAFSNASIGWGIVDSGPAKDDSVARTTQDAGLTWIDAASPCDASPFGHPRVIAVTGSTGIAVCAFGGSAGGEPRAVLATADAGRRWTTVASTGYGGSPPLGRIAYGGYVRGLVVAQDGTAWLTGDRMVPLVSSDGGSTWASLGLGDPDANMVLAAWPLNRTEGMALMWSPERQSTLLEATSNGGGTWIERAAWPVDGP